MIIPRDDSGFRTEPSFPDYEAWIKSWVFGTPDPRQAYIDGLYVGDITQLPRWAQDYIAHLRTKLQEKE